MDNVIYLSESWPDAVICGYTKPGWYFWDVSHYCRGPFESEEEARHSYGRYVEKLNMPCKKIPLHEFEKEVSVLLTKLLVDILLDDDDVYPHLWNQKYTAKISEAAVRILLDGDK